MGKWEHECVDLQYRKQGEIGSVLEGGPRG